MNLQMMVYISLLAFLGLILGGVLGGVVNKAVKQVNKLYVYSGALVLGIILFEIVPESSKTFDWIGVSISVLIGLVLMHQIHLLTESLQAKLSKTRAISFATVFLVVAIAIHNLPSGIAISSNSVNQNLSNEIIFSFVIHQIPEGLALFLSLVSVGSAFYSIISFVSLSLFLVLCFFLALLLGEQTLFQDNRLRAIFMGVSIGTLSYVSVVELIMRSFNKLRLGQFIPSFCLGIITILFFIQFVQAH